MQMNNQTHNRWLPILLATVVLIVVALLAPLLAGAEQNPPKEISPAAEVSQTQQTPPESEAETSEQQQAGQPSPPETGIPAKTIKPFNPSETIGADSAVSAPVDKSHPRNEKKLPHRTGLPHLFIVNRIYPDSRHLCHRGATASQGVY
jgi:cytoskeletal protein RodZ